MEPKNELFMNAVALARRKELESYQRALDVQWMNDRMEDGRMGRCLALIQREAEMEKDFQERTDHSAIVNARSRKEIDLAVEVAKLKNEEACTLLRRHYLRERDPALRTLMKKLQAGYVCRDLKQQILHNEYKRLQDKAEELRANTILQEALASDKDAMAMEAKAKMLSTSEYRRHLQAQLINRTRERQCQYEETLIEKKMLEDIMRTIADEDKRELEQKRMLTERSRREMEQSQRARIAWRDKQKQVLMQEEKEIEKQQQAASDRSASIIAERQRKLKQREDINAVIAAKILADEEERQDRENIIKQLQEQEYLEKNHQCDLSEKRKQETVREETERSLTMQKELKEKLRLEEKQREIDLRKKTEAKIAADEMKEHEKERLKRENNKKYNQDLLKQIEDNARRRKKEADGEQQRAQNVWDYEKNWQAEVSKERKSIIEDHAPYLIGYLQPGVLKKQDLPNIKEGVKKDPKLATLDIDSIAGSNRPKRRPKCNAQCRILREF